MDVTALESCQENGRQSKDAPTAKFDAQVLELLRDGSRKNVERRFHDGSNQGRSSARSGGIAHGFPHLPKGGTALHVRLYGNEAKVCDSHILYSFSCVNADIFEDTAKQNGGDYRISFY